MHIIITIASWALIILLFLQPGTAHKGAVEGMRIFTTALLPYLLPYLVITQMFIRSQNNFLHTTNKFKLYLNVYILSAIGGFPSGAAVISSLKEMGTLNERNASWLLGICHAPSPMFVIGFVGIEIFHEEFAGLKLLIIIHLINLIFLLVFIFFSKPIQQNEYKATIAISPFQESIKETSQILLLIGTTVIFFTTVSIVVFESVKEVLPSISPLLLVFVASFFEMTGGISLAGEILAGKAVLPFIVAIIVAFSGLSIHMQIIVLAQKARIPIKRYILFRFLHMLIIPLFFII
ncbi:hypothetical protein [Psychrobacillus lasiicapitis]|uniref:Nucleoside recognition protein n=1 Tax=Psychrobacillus lasiicapitis TaxID=1636719 RepID=A0A544TEM8_9BACI|nr:hypothetical protein [Psychrobacillus lasiicapitis]TQR15911.1 hypothetical protein FG382_04140 [Psychrobacillus lasiicapitis]GGA17090.1 sporulation integral membrane protein YlbJ [Psychrobacillus lasiicapitis]